MKSANFTALLLVIGAILLVQALSLVFLFVFQLIVEIDECEIKSKTEW